MRLFNSLSTAQLERLFDVAPVEFDSRSSRERLSMSLGATLYTPATRSELADAVLARAQAGVTSMVLCLEDAVPDAEVPAAEQNLIAALTTLHEASRDGVEAPLLFVRVRSPEQLTSIAARLGPAVARLTGFVLPKFGPDNGEAYLRALIQAQLDHGHWLYCMPVLESSAVAFGEQRPATLRWILRALRAHRDRVLAIRLGATDLSGLYGLRRQPEMTVYDVRVVSAMIADVINYLGRSEDGFVITGPVWEYFSAAERIFRPRLRQSLFETHDVAELRIQLLNRDMDGLIREVELDKTNGIVGKTVIHPSHVPIVHSLLVVSHEEYADALDIVAASGGGVAASGYRNKMNESKPHLNWAKRTLSRGQTFGVAKPEVAFVDILAANLLV